MRPSFCIVSVFASLGCGSSSSPPNISNFTGAPWIVTETFSVDCQGQTESESGSLTIPFGVSSNGISYTSSTGCVYDFSVSGDTATLSDSPLTCSADTSLGTVVITVQSYTATSDGANLTTVTTGTETVEGVTCNLTINGSGTRSQ